MRRQSELTELMDAPNVDRTALATSLQFIRRVNRHLGGTRAVLNHLKNWSRHWPRAALHPITFLDVATGSADIPLAILDWSTQQNFNLQITALDLHATTLELAQQHITQTWRNPTPPPIQLLRADALALPFADRSIDYVLSSMFLHHLSNENAAAAVAEMVRVARRGVIVNDLLRSTFARIGIHLLTLFADKIDKHDARVSVRKAWTQSEVEPWRISANAPWLVYHEHIPARFTLAGERPETKGSPCRRLLTWQYVLIAAGWLIAFLSLPLDGAKLNGFLLWRGDVDTKHLLQFLFALPRQVFREWNDPAIRQGIHPNGIVAPTTFAFGDLLWLALVLAGLLAFIFAPIYVRKQRELSRTTQTVVRCFAPIILIFPLTIFAPPVWSFPIAQIGMCLLGFAHLLIFLAIVLAPRPSSERHFPVLPNPG